MAKMSWSLVSEGDFLCLVFVRSVSPVCDAIRMIVPRRGYNEKSATLVSCHQLTCYTKWFSAHANTLRGLVKTIDQISDEDIQNIAIPTGIPIIYKFDQNMKPIPPDGGQGSSQKYMNGVFLEKPGLLATALKREEEWSNQVPGYNPTMKRTQTPLGTLERSLYKLQAEREMEKWANQFVDPNVSPEDDGTDGNMGRPIELVDHDHSIAKAKYSSNQKIIDMDGEPVTANLVSSSACVTAMPSASVLPGHGEPVERRDAVIVIIRHGKTEHNKLGLFTVSADSAVYASVPRSCHTFLLTFL